MTVNTVSSKISSPARFDFRKYLRAFWRQRWLYFLMLPTLVYFAIFKYGPLWNAQIAFKDFKPVRPSAIAAPRVRGLRFRVRFTPHPTRGHPSWTSSS